MIVWWVFLCRNKITFFITKYITYNRFRHIMRCQKVPIEILNIQAVLLFFLNKRKRKLLMNAFSKSQYSYCPLSWMFHSRTLNNKMNRLHERCLRIIYNDNISSFTDLVEVDNSVSVHHRTIKVLATELYKFVNGLSPKLVRDCFKLNNMAVYNTRNRSIFYSRPVRTVLHGTESLSHLGPKIWELVPSDMKNLSSLTAFKKAIKQWKPHACPCRLCRTYIYQVGFV